MLLFVASHVAARQRQNSHVTSRAVSRAIGNLPFAFLAVSVRQDVQAAQAEWSKGDDETLEGSRGELVGLGGSEVLALRQRVERTLQRRHARPEALLSKECRRLVCIAARD